MTCRWPRRGDEPRDPRVCREAGGRQAKCDRSADSSDSHQAKQPAPSLPPFQVSSYCIHSPCSCRHTGEGCGFNGKVSLPLCIRQAFWESYSSKSSGISLCFLSVHSFPLKQFAEAWANEVLPQGHNMTQLAMQATRISCNSCCKGHADRQRSRGRPTKDSSISCCGALPFCGAQLSQQAQPHDSHVSCSQVLRLALPDRNRKAWRALYNSKVFSLSLPAQSLLLLIENLRQPLLSHGTILDTTRTESWLLVPSLLSKMRV